MKQESKVKAVASGKKSVAGKKKIASPALKMWQQGTAF
jgi:hypothetical protein